jgi:hydroxymethylglutaryl-CoA lyase
MLSSLSGSVTVYEVSPRDGLQNETSILSLAAKRELIEALVQAGLRHIEVTSFVSPRWVPQLADAVELVQSLAPAPGVSFSALCPNATGLERAKLAGLKEVAIFLSASESHNQRNTNKSIQRSLEVFEELIPAARDAGLRVRAYISTVWGCPYEGEVDPQRALEIARDLVRWGVYQVSLGDTIGIGTPLQTQRICQLFLAEFAQEQLALHFHDTRGTALSNVLVGLDAGIRTFDAAVAGLGGCPYAPGASGNLATEDLVYLLHGMGLETGINLQALIEAGEVAERVVGRKLPGKVHQAGLPRKR